MKRHLTAITRKKLSKPARLALEQNLIQQGDRLLDYGCGRGSDVKLLIKKGVDAVGFDPYFFPETDCSGTWDVVTLNYVLNVIDNVEERRQTLEKAWDLCNCILLVAVRTDKEKVKGEVFGDGIKTQRDTFQKLFSLQEVEEMVYDTLYERPCWIGEGIFFLTKGEDR